MSPILENKNILKVGFALEQDVSLLRKNYGIKLNGTLDLSQRLRTRKLVAGLVDCVTIYLQVPFTKDKKISMSNWAMPLHDYSNAMVAYAANDAYMALKVYDAWKAGGEEVKPIPKHEAHYVMFVQQQEQKKARKAAEEQERLKKAAEAEEKRVKQPATAAAEQEIANAQKQS